jgi:hypothetical protein
MNFIYLLSNMTQNTCFALQYNRQMIKNRYEKLGQLLESKNQLVRREAVDALSFLPIGLY